LLKSFRLDFQNKAERCISESIESTSDILSNFIMNDRFSIKVRKFPKTISLNKLKGIDVIVLN